MSCDLNSQLLKKMSKKEEVKETKVRSDITVVAQDTDWRTYVGKEIYAENTFAENWGFLFKSAQGKQCFRFTFLDGKKIATTKDERLAELEMQLKLNKAKFMTTSNNTYGEPKKGLEAFNNSVHNVLKSTDLMPCPRRPAKK